MNCPKANGCRHYLTGIGCMVCENENNFKPLRETNYDRIISKSPEDLAAYLSHLELSWRPVYSRKDRNEWLEWLKQEVVNDD